MANGQVTPEYKKAHLEMIQGVINRMAHNSFLLKGWSVVLVSALFALAGKQENFFFAILALFPALAFWGLDGYFLRQEKLFRKLYDDVRVKEEKNIDFSMNTSNFVTPEDAWEKVTFSLTLSIFHGVILAAIAAVIVYLAATCTPQATKAISSLSTMARHLGGLC